MKYGLAGLLAAAACYSLVIPTSPRPASGRSETQEGRWSWRGRLAAGQSIEIRGVNGSISAEPASRNEVEVAAIKRGRRSDPDEVRIDVVEHDGGVTICAVYPGRHNRCEPGGGHMSVGNNDVEVEFTVSVPRGLVFAGHNVNGGVEALDLDGPVEVETVNGSITTDFPIVVRGRLTPRHLRGRIGQGGQPLRLETVNGSIRIRALS